MPTFCIGNPKRYAIPSAEEVIQDIAHSPGDRALIAVVSLSSIFLWSGAQHTSLVGSFIRKSLNQGVNQSICWHPDGNRFVIITSEGYILFYALELKPYTEEVSVTNGKESTVSYLAIHLPPRVKISLTDSLHIGASRINCVSSTAEILFAGTSNGSIVKIRWSSKAKVLEEIPLAQILKPRETRISSPKQAPASPPHSAASSNTNATSPQQLQQPVATSTSSSTPSPNGSANNTSSTSNSSASLLLPKPPSIGQSMNRIGSNLWCAPEVVAMDYNPVLQTIAAIFADGTASLVFVPEKNKYWAEWIPINNGAVCAALNSRNFVVAIGMEDGQTLLYHIPSSSVHSATISYLRTFSLNDWGLTGDDTGAVRSLKWTPDQAALAVAWTRRGLSVWSLHGCRLFCTIPQSEGIARIASRGGGGTHRSNSNSSSGITASQNVNNNNSTNSNSNSRKGSLTIPPLSDINNNNSSKPNLSLKSSTNSSSLLLSAVSNSFFAEKGNLNSNQREVLRQGVTALSWGRKGYRLLVVSKQSNAEMLQFSFYQSCLSTNPNLNYSEHVMLQGDDRLLFLSSSAQKPKGPLAWKHLQLPQTYLDDNWPILHVAVSRDREHIAVAGRRGVAVYSATDKRWKLFGDRLQEQEIKAVGLCWYRHLVIVFCENPKDSSKYEIRMYPRNHLASSSIVLRLEIPAGRVPQFVDCNDHFLVFLTTDSMLYQYQLTATQRGPQLADVSVRAEFLHQISTATLGKDLLSLLLLPDDAASKAASQQTLIANSNTTSAASKYNNSNRNDLSAKCLVLSCTGQLSVIDAQEVHRTPLAQNVEQFWFGGDLYTSYLGQSVSSNNANATVNANDTSGGNTSNTTPSPSSSSSSVAARQRNALQGTTLWTYGAKGLQVYFPFDTAAGTLQPQQLNATDRSLAFDNEVYPVGFVPELGMIVGITQGVQYTKSDSFSPSFELQTKTHPFLHSILRHLLELHGRAEAEAVAKKFSFIPYFTHSLEMLLHQTLEEEEDSTALSKPGSSASSSEKKTSPSGLSAVIEFLKPFPQYADVLVRCARKRDKAVWPYLFRVAGSPKPLFEIALAGRRSDTAASFLLVLHHLEGSAAARRAAHKLLELVLDNNDLVLLRDLMRFLEPAVDLVDEVTAADVAKNSAASPMNISKKYSLTPSLRSASPSTSSNSVSNSSTIASNKIVANSSIEIREFDATPDDEEFYLQEMLLGRYAKKLLSLKELRTLLQFGKIVNRDLRTWLMRERRRSAVVEDWPESLQLIHDQFQWPYPSPSTDFSSVNVAALLSKNQSASSSSLLSQSTSSLASSSNTASPNLAMMESPLQQQTRQELSYLLQEMQSGQCVEWALVIATALLNLSAVASLLREHPYHWKSYQKMLATQDCSAYKELLRVLTAQLGDQLIDNGPAPSSARLAQK